MRKNSWLLINELLEKTKASIPELASLSCTDERVLRWIINSQNVGEGLNVQDALASRLASPATIWKSIHTLTEAGLIDSKVDSADRRCKILAPSAKVEKILQKLDLSVRAWTKKNA